LLLWGYQDVARRPHWRIPVNVTTGDLTVNRTLGSVVIASGNTLEALMGAYPVNRFARGARAFERAQDAMFRATGPVPLAGPIFSEARPYQASAASESTEGALAFMAYCSRGGTRIVSGCGAFDNSPYLLALVRLDQYIVAAQLQDIHPELVIAKA
jgi:hypothetical protein